MAAKDLSEQDDTLVEEILQIDLLQDFPEHLTWVENSDFFNFASFSYFSQH
jgi:hypothetical protein